MSKPSAIPVPRSAWLLAALGVAAFAFSVPMTRLASGSSAQPLLSPWFVAFGRALLAALLAGSYLLLVGARRPSTAQWRRLIGMAAGVVFGWPVLLGLALREVDAVHGALLSGLLPLATAALAAWLLGQRAPLRFWVWALVALALVLGFAALQGAGRLVPADLLLLGAVASAAYGYVQGAQLSREMAPLQVISWAVLLCLPLTLPLTLATMPVQSVPWSAWVGFLYVGIVSMWLGFVPWYAALARGGALRVSQVQVAQPFLSGLLAVPLLGESLPPLTLAFLLAVVGSVWMGQRARL